MTLKIENLKLPHEIYFSQDSFWFSYERRYKLYSICLCDAEYVSSEGSASEVETVA